MDTTPPNKPDISITGKKKKKKKLGTNRGVETLFRNTYRVHVEVSNLADSKANFLISVNSIIMVLVVAHGMQYVSERALFIPVAIIIAVSITSMIYAVLVARPQISKTKIPEDLTKKNSSNLLFFGSFTQMTKDDFINTLSERIQDVDQLYPMMMSDIYDHGLVLRRKFRRLQIAYNILLYGMPLGVIIFVIMQGVIVARAIQQ